MSTISEALRKVQNQRMPGIPAPATPQNQVPEKISRALLFFLILLAVLITAGILLYCFRSPSFPNVAGYGILPVPPVNLEPVADKAPVKVDPPVVVPVEPPAPAPALPPATAGVVTQPISTHSVRTDLPVLGGIFYSEKRPVAIINGSSLMEGEKVGRYQVIKINVYSVTLKCDDGEVELRLN